MDQKSIPDCRLTGEGLHSCVSVQLDVLSRSVQELEEPVHNLVFPNALVAHEEYLLAQMEILKHVFHQVEVLRHVVEQDVGDFGQMGGLVDRNRGLANGEDVVLDFAHDGTAVVETFLWNNPKSLDGPLQSLPSQRGQKLNHEGCLDGVVRGTRRIVLHPGGNPQQLPRRQVPRQALKRLVATVAQNMSQFHHFVQSFGRNSVLKNSSHKLPTQTALFLHLT